MTKERYLELLEMRASDEITKPENVKDFNELQNFERKIRKIAMTHLINEDKNASISEVEAELNSMPHDKLVNIAIDNQNIKPNKIAEQYLKDWVA